MIQKGYHAGTDVVHLSRDHITSILTQFILYVVIYCRNLCGAAVRVNKFAVFAQDIPTVAGCYGVFLLELEN